MAAKNDWEDGDAFTHEDQNTLADEVNAKAASSGLATVASSGSYTDLSDTPGAPAWNTITGKPLVDVGGTVGNGIADDRAALATSDDAALAASLPLMLLPGTYKVSTDITIDSPVWFAGGAVIKPDAGVTVTLSGGIVNAPMSQIFDVSAGSTVGGSPSTSAVVAGLATCAVATGTTCYPEWWGALGDDSNDDGPAILGMLWANAAVVGGVSAFFSAGKTYCSSLAFEVQSNSYITGHGTIKCTEDTPGGRGAVVMMANGVTDIIWDGPAVDGNFTTNANPFSIGTGVGFDPEDPYNENIVVRTTVKNARIDPLDETVGWVHAGGGKGFSIQGRTKNVRADIIAQNCDFGATIEAGTTDGRDCTTTVLNLISSDARRSHLLVMGSTPAGVGSAVSAAADHGRFPGLIANLIALDGQTEDIIDPSDDVTEYPNNHYFGVVTSMGACGAQINAHCSVSTPDTTLLRGKLFASEVNITAYMDDLQYAWDSRNIEDTGSTFTYTMDNKINIDVHTAAHSGTLIRLDTDTDYIRRTVINMDVWCEGGVGAIVNDAGTADFGTSVFYRFRNVKTLAEVSGNSTIEAKPEWSMAPSVGGRVALQAYSVISDGDTTPSVSNGAVSLMRTNNSSPTTITNLDNGRVGQVVTIRFGDSDTTVAHGGSLLIRLSGAANTTFVSADTLTLVFDGTGWVEIARTNTTGSFTLSGSASLDFPALTDSSHEDLTITVTGAVVGDCVALATPTEAVTAGVAFTAWVSAADTVTVRAHNYTSGTPDPVSGTFKVAIVR